MSQTICKPENNTVKLVLRTMSAVKFLLFHSLDFENYGPSIVKHS